MLLVKIIQPTKQPAFQQISMPVPQKLSPGVTFDRAFIHPGSSPASQTSDLLATGAGVLHVAQHTGPVTQSTIFG